MPLYYEDESVRLYHGDSLEILPTLDITAADVLLTDPPYFKVKQEEWDNQWDKASEFLGWMGDFLDRAKPLLAPHASVWVFASPAMTSSVERLVGERFRVLNSIRWAKSGGDNLRRVSMPAMRSFVSIWEGIVFAEQKDQDELLRREIFAQAGGYILRERERAGLSRRELAKRLTGYKNEDSANANIFNWELGKNLISRSDYSRLRDVLGHGYLERSYESVEQEHQSLQAKYSSLRRPFLVSDRRLAEDIWAFPSVAGHPGKHPCEKPQPLLRHMIETSSRPGGLILDPFAGSGSTLLAASHAGRRAIGIEKDEQWCEHAANRLSQGTLDIFGAVA